MTNGWPFDGWVIVVAMDNGTGCSGYNGMPRLVFKWAIKILNGGEKIFENKKATISTATLVLIHGILDAENQELMVVHQKIVETKLQSRTTLFIRGDTE